MDVFIDDFHYYRDLPMTVKGNDPIPDGVMRKIL